ncbi:4533_t:CDS:2 [Cetraspora pellucida]|uniref:4533_t:CDS:1 n=1 Tax=Cetraspora pellucida TaxID=1433469 RepID=A0A9N9CV23_9GLOM|nr:4533_t:CDS:2 [Cetraspora pellucida]
MKKDLSEDIIKDEESSKNKDNNLSNEYEDFNEIIQINNMERNSALQFLIHYKKYSTLQTNKSSLINSVLEEHELKNIEDNYTMQQQTIFNNQQIQFTTDDASKQIVSAQDNFTSNQERITKDKQVANKNLEDYHSKMKCQMHTKYNIHKHVYEVGDLVKIQVTKIDRGLTFSASIVLSLRPKEYLELDNPLTNVTVSIIEVARL